ncbi:MAG: hypothetical protein AAGA93_06905 [Actinomycetota bacterium]
MANTKLITLAIVALAAILTPVGAASAATSVTVNSSGDLLITGDNGAQDIHMTTNDDGQLVVEVENGSTTTIHVINGFHRDLIVDLKGGDDTFGVSYAGPLNAREVHLDLGGGANSAGLKGVSVRDLIEVRDLGGSSTVFFDEVDLDGDLDVAMGAGDNRFRGVVLAVDGETSVTSGSNGSLDASFDVAIFRGPLSITGTNNVDSVTLKRVTVPFGAGPGLSVDTKGSADKVQLIRSDLDEPTEIKTGGGNDRLHVTLGIIRDFEFNGGSGDDIVSTFGASYVTSSVFNGSGGQDYISGEANWFSNPPSLISITAN